MRRNILISAVIIVGFAWGQTAAVPYSLEHDGILRTYVVFEPATGQGQDGYPLIVGLHGTGATGEQFLLTTALPLLANTEGIILVCPDALLFDRQTFFNAGGSFEDLTGGVDDIGFISAMIDEVAAGYDVDESRIYVMGFSNGSATAYRVAAELSDRIAAMGSVSGQMVYDERHPVSPVPIIYFHGLSDRFIPYEGNGEGIPSVESVLDIWRGINGCTSDPDTVCDRNGILGLRWESASGNGEVELYTIEDQVHEWPRITSLQISATNTIWNFIKGYSRN